VEWAITGEVEVDRSVGLDLPTDASAVAERLAERVIDLGAGKGRCDETLDLDAKSSVGRRSKGRRERSPRGGGGSRAHEFDEGVFGECAEKENQCFLGVNADAGFDGPEIMDDIRIARVASGIAQRWGCGFGRCIGGKKDAGSAERVKE
jgi:hypothetical protein